MLLLEYVVRSRLTVENADRSPSAFPVSLFRTAGFSPPGFSPFDLSRRAVNPAWQNGKYSRRAAIGLPSWRNSRVVVRVP